MNKIKLAGMVQNFGISHSVSGETIYSGTLSVPRFSGVCDNIPFSTPHSFIYNGELLEIEGEIRTCNYTDENGNNHKKMWVKFNNFTEVFPPDEECSYENSVELQGYLVTKQELRKTPKGKTVMDFIIATDHAYGKSSYISCIAWGGVAEYLSRLSIGDEITLKGRFQSREYQKDTPYGRETRTAYEISVKTLNLV